MLLIHFLLSTFSGKPIFNRIDRLRHFINKLSQAVIRKKRGHNNFCRHQLKSTYNNPPYHSENDTQNATASGIYLDKDLF